MQPRNEIQTMANGRSQRTIMGACDGSLLVANNRYTLFYTRLFALFSLLLLTSGYAVGARVQDETPAVATPIVDSGVAKSDSAASDSAASDSAASDSAGSDSAASDTAKGSAAGAEVDSDGSTGQKRTMLQMMFTGNPFGIAIVVVILLLSVVSTILIVENAISIRRKCLLPPEVMESLESALALRDTRGAMMICNDVDNYSMATQVVQAGLERFRSSEFGFAEYRSAVEEAGEHITGRLYRKVEVLNVIASIAPMLGLTGTVVGMIDAFNTIAANQGAAGPEDLAGGIGQALITTLLGLVVAIPTMVAFSYFRSKIDSLVSEAGTRIERIMLPLGRRKTK